jgi:PAS domain S-box-containing protein
MRFKHKTKQELINMLEQLQHRVKELEAQEEIRTKSFKRIVELSPFPTVIINRSGITEYINSEFTKTFGYTLKDVASAEDWFRLAYPDDDYREKAWSEWSQSVSEVSNGDIIKCTYDVTCNDGTVKNIVFRLIKIDAERLFLILEDITELKTAEKELRGEMGYLRAILLAIPEIVFVLDEDGHYLDVLTTQSELLFLDKEELQGKSLHELLPIDVADRALEAIRNAINTQETQAIEYALNVHKGLHWFEGRTCPIETSADEPNRVVWVAYDITDRKKAEKKILESEERYRWVNENIKDVIYSADSEGNLTFISGAYEELLGYSREELLGKSFWELSSIIRLPDENARRLLREYHKAIQERRETTEYEFVLNVNGRYRYFEVKEKIHYEGDAVQGTTGIMRDITARKEAETKLKETLAELERSNNALEHFATVISHDLSQPLTVVKGFLDMVNRNFKDRFDPHVRSFVEKAARNAEKMDQFMSDVLKYSKAGGSKFCIENVDCNLVLKQVLDNLQNLIDKRNAAVIVHFLPCIEGNFTQFVQIFQNLITNAIKYCNRQNPEVHVSAERQGEEWIFQVRDNGIGIEKAKSEEIFEFLYRLESEDYSGSGIGLAVCKRNVEWHGGKIWVESEPNKGSTFYFSIPAT